MHALNRKGRAFKLTGMIAAIGLAIIVYVYVFNSQDDPGSFRGIRWGSHIQQLSGMQLLAEDGDLRFYVREDDRLKIGDVALDRLIYGFYKDRFYNVMMYYNSPESFSRTKEILSREHGNPYQPSESEKKFYWETDDVHLLLTYDDGSNQGRVSYLFKPIESEMEGSEKADTNGPS